MHLPQNDSVSHSFFVEIIGHISSQVGISAEGLDDGELLFDGLSEGIYDSDGESVIPIGGVSRRVAVGNEDIEGTADFVFDGTFEGTEVGRSEGKPDGSLVGSTLAVTVGAPEGYTLGLSDGADEALGPNDG